MPGPSFTDLNTDAGLKKFNGFLTKNSFTSGYYPSQDDVYYFKQVSNNLDAKAYPAVARFMTFVSSFPATVRATWPGEYKEYVEPESEEEEEEEESSEEEAAPKGKGKAAAGSDDDSDDSDDDDDDDDDSSDFNLSDSDDDEATKKMFAAKAEKIKAIQERQAAKAGKARSNLTLDIKPMDSDTDMAELEEQIRAIEIEGVTWLGGSLIDMVYGLQKLRIMCQLVDALTNPDSVREEVEELEGVQSTDIFAFQMA